jgi:hypothetical protein
MCVATLAIVADGEIVFAVLPATRDGDLPRVRVDAVLDQLGDSFQRVALRQGNNPDGVPVIADSQLTLCVRSTCHESVRFCVGLELHLVLVQRSTVTVKPNSVHHDQSFFQKVDPPFQIPRFKRSPCFLFRHSNHRIGAHTYANQTVPLRDTSQQALVHQVSDWYSGVAIKMGRRQGVTKEHI